MFLDIEDFLRNVGGLYEHFLASENDNDYVVNDEHFQHLLDIIEFFADICGKCDGSYEPCELSPKRRSGGVTARFYVLSLNGENIERFCELMKYTSAISIDAETDGKVCFSVTVPNVFVKK